MESGIKIAICDDEAASRENMEMMCRAFFGERELSLGMPEIHVFASGKEMTASSGDYDILLLDIEMPEQDGIRIKELFEKNRKRTRIIFTTSHRERVLEAFGKNVVSFLVKPLCKEDFQKAMEKTLSDLCGQVLEIEENGETFLIPVKQIRYIEAQDKYTLAVMETEEYLMRRTMKFWESALPSQDFVRIHKSYLVNLEYFEKKGDEVRLGGGKTVRMSRLRKNGIMEKYKEFLRRKV
ncbi:MAG: response regulator transcription factor [Lachnospiraceae bacterium]|nr:response regulator transcription factor [Lachnospiraceae bacterium]